MTPMTSSTWSGPMPPPVHAPPATGFERGHERVGAVVEVEQRALGALEQDVLAARERAPGRARSCRRGGRAAARPSRRPRSTSGVDLEGVGAHRAEQQRSCRAGARAEPLAQDVAIEEVVHPEPDAPRAVAVGRADAAPRRPDLRAVEPRLVRPVEGHVVRHDHVRAAADPDARRRRSRARSACPARR